MRVELDSIFKIAGKVSRPLNASHLVIPLLLSPLNPGGILNTIPGHWLCLNTIRLEERGIQPGPLSPTTAKTLARYFNRTTEPENPGIKVFSHPIKPLNFDLRESRQPGSLVNVPQLTITSLEQTISSRLRVVKMLNQGSHHIIDDKPTK